MSNSDCHGCWETPCVCNDAKGYAHLSLNHIRTIHAATGRLIRRLEAAGAENAPDASELEREALGIDQE